MGITAGIALAFSFLRPYNQVVYAPKVKHADERHAPPPLGKGIFAWFVPLWTVGEADLVRYVGLDAAVFMRFTRMCMAIFLVLSIVGIAVLIPVNLTHNSGVPNQDWLAMLTPSNVFGGPQWSQVVVAYLFNATICGFLWWNYRKVVALRRAYFESDAYQRSLNARTLMMFDIPDNMRSDEGIARIIDEVAPSSSFSRTAIARDVKDLPSLIDQHAETVKALEKVLAKYLKDPHNLPAARPVCRPSRKHAVYAGYPQGQKVDAIEYLTERIKRLETEIREVRLSVDKRSSMNYGFASYVDMAEAHAIAFAARKSHPYGATIKLAPRPEDIIWDNMALTPSTRSWRRAIVNLWILALTLLWIAPNAMIAIFLVNLGNLARVWEAFRHSLEANTAFWGIVQGVASPALTSLIYLILPIIFRRLSVRAGDKTKTGRERHVMAKLYAFFVFNNLVVFSIFNAVWTFTTHVIQETGKGTDAWQAILKEGLGTTVFVALCNISPFWITWLLQRQLGAAVDLAQLWTLVYSFLMRKFSSPTPRELIELTAPPAFDYASYYNYFLFYSTVALCYAGIQPLVLPAAALYFAIDVFLKKYLLLYIFVTKTESGGMFWRVLFNRWIFATILANLVVFLTVWVRGEGNHFQAYAVAPLPFLMLAFKLYCRLAFDDKIYFYSTRLGEGPESAVPSKDQRANQLDRLSSRFGHPALYKALITPMVHARAQNILASVYQGRLTDGRDVLGASSIDERSISGYSDTVALDPMHAGQPGKSAVASYHHHQQTDVPNFELIPESKLDFEFYKNRAEFASEHGGTGELYGRQRGDDIFRPGTPSSMSLFDGESRGSRPSSPAPGVVLGGAFGPAVAARSSRLFSPGMVGADTAYHGPAANVSPACGSLGGLGLMNSPIRTHGPSPYSQYPDNGSQTALVPGEGSFAASTPPAVTTGSAASSRDQSVDGRMSLVAPTPLRPGSVNAGMTMAMGSPQAGVARSGTPSGSGGGTGRTSSGAWGSVGLSGGPPPGPGYAGIPVGLGSEAAPMHQQQQFSHQNHQPQDPGQYDYFRQPRPRKSGGW